MKLRELYGVLGHGKDSAKIIEADMTDASEEWTGFSQDIMDRDVRSVWAVNRSDREGIVSGLGGFVIHIEPIARSNNGD